MQTVPQADAHLLFIDESDDSDYLFRNLLTSHFLCDTAKSVAEAVSELSAKQHSVALFNLSSDLDGRFDTIEKIKSVAPYTEIVLLGAEVSADQTVRAFRAGIFDLLLVPIEYAEVEGVIERAVESAERKRHSHHYRSHLEHIAAERANEIDRALEEIESAYRVTLTALVQALETRDLETHGHSERVVTFSLRLGHEIGLDRDALKHLELGALLHDIGKIGVPDAILRKPAKLNEEEWVKMRLHPIHGEKILRNIGFLEGAGKIVLQHHEFWDGSGYPHRLRGDGIDIGARIFAVIDAFDAITSDRVYRAGRSYEEAVAELDLCTGSQFDPEVVKAFKSVPREDWEALRARSVREKSDLTSFQEVVQDLLRSRMRTDLVN